MRTTLVILFCCIVATAHASLTDGLLAYFPFNGNATDATSNGYDGSVSNAAPTLDRFGSPAGAYSFNGSNSFIKVSKLLPNLTNLTISAWVQYESGSYQNGYGVILDDSDTTPSNDFEFGIPNSTNAQIVATKNGSSTTLNALLGRNILNTWVQLAWVGTATNSTVYLDGSPVFTAAKAGSDVGLHAPPLIGATASINNRGAFFGGKIDDLRIYNRALASAEVQELFTLESGPQVTFVKAFTVDFANLTIGSNYVLQASTDMTTWTNYATPFTATTVDFTNTSYQRIDDWNKLFFRLQAYP